MKSRLKKIIYTVAAICLAAGLISACAASENGVNNIKLVSNGTLTVCTDVSYPPFEYFDEDGLTPVGADIDLINEVAERLGLKVRFINHAFDGIFDELGSRYDVVCSAVTVTEDRLKDMIFSVPYMDNYQCAVVPSEGGMEMLSFEDLDKMTVAVKRGTTAEKLVERINSSGNADIRLFTSEQSKGCFDMLEEGMVDAVICDSILAAGVIKTSDGKFEEAFRDTNSPEEIAIAISSGNTELKAAIDEVLIQMEADGTTKKIMEKWSQID